MSVEKCDFFIVGCGGHARSVADVVEKNEGLAYFFLDDHAQPNEKIFGKPCWQQLPENMQARKDAMFIVAIGNNAKRAEIFSFFKKSFQPRSVIAKTAWIGTEAIIEKGTFIANAAHIGPLAHVKANTIVNTQAVIEHEVIIGEHTHIAIGAVVGGRSKIGNFVFVGAGATIIDSITICDHATIGAGAVVVEDITEPGLYLGIPAKRKA